MFESVMEIGTKKFHFIDLKKLYQEYPKLKRLPTSLKLLLESNLRNNNFTNQKNIIEIFLQRNSYKTIEFFPNRVIMENSIAISSILELVSFPNKLAPKVFFDLILNNSSNKQKDKEEFTFIKWAKNNVENFSLIPPNDDNNKQVNIEFLSTLICSSNKNEKNYIYPEAIVGTDFYVTKINALGVLGFKLNSLKAKASIMGETVSFLFPEVIGIEVKGSLAQGVSILDIELSLALLLEKENIDGKIVEFYGKGLKNISIEDRAILSHKVTEYKALCGFFSFDENTKSFIKKTRGVETNFLYEYFHNQSLDSLCENIEFDRVLSFDLSSLKAVVLGPKKIQDRTYVDEIDLINYKKGNFVKDNDVVLAYINANCSNLSLLIQAGLLAKNAVNLNLQINKNIKRVFILGSKSISRYLDELGLLNYFAKLGFYFTTNEQEYELIERVVLDIEKFNLNVSSINYNFKNIENTHLLTKSNWFMSPTLILAYCLKGTMNCNIIKDSIQSDIYLKDIWPSISEVNDYLEKISTNSYINTYSEIFKGDEFWEDIKISDDENFDFKIENTYIKEYDYSYYLSNEFINLTDAKILAIYNDKVNMKNLSAYGKIPPYSSSSNYLQEKGLKPDNFFNFEDRVCNSELLKRGCLSSINLKNAIVSPKEGGYTKDFETNEVVTIFELSQRLKEKNSDIVIIAKDDFANGEFFEWSVKGLKYLGVKVILANSFYEEFRIALIDEGILPLEFIDDSIDSLYLKGNETLNIEQKSIISQSKIDIQIKNDSQIKNIKVKCRLDTNKEVTVFRSGSLLKYLINQ